MLDRQSPAGRGRRTLAREGLWALSCLLAVTTLYVTVVTNMEGGPHHGLLDIPASAWATLWDKFLGGHFWIVTAVVYGLVQITRLTVWAVQMARH